ncbi:MAG TPA: response regulator, partial [Bryobacteraceae bacterium]|nr:response regulator [Bryobacteraceae bacterium]
TQPQLPGSVVKENGSSKAAGKPLRLLLVDDNGVNQNLMARILGKRGHVVVTAGNGREALEALLEQTFDLILMDVQMPEMDGLEATRMIREKEIGTGRHQPIVALTAHALKADVQLCEDAGMDGYVSKPIRTELLMQTIHAVLRAKGEKFVLCDPLPAVKP